MLVQCESSPLTLCVCLLSSLSLSLFLSVQVLDSALLADHCNHFAGMSSATEMDVVVCHGMLS